VLGIPTSAGLLLKEFVLDKYIPIGMLKLMLEDEDIPLKKRIAVAEEQVEYHNNVANAIQKHFLDKLYDQRDEDEVDWDWDRY
jgi:hypothetical protein